MDLQLSQAKLSLLVLVAGLLIALSIADGQPGGQDQSGPAAAQQPASSEETGHTEKKPGEANQNLASVVAGVREVVREELEETRSLNQVLTVFAGLFGAFLGAMGAIGGAWLTAKHQHKAQLQQQTHQQDAQLQQQKHQQEAQHQQYLIGSLKWFEGDTQKRSIGIAVAESYWSKFDPSFRGTWISVLAGQAIHLLTVSKQCDSPVEKSNLKRILNLLLGKSLTDLEKNQVLDLRKALLENSPRLDRDEETPPKGVHLEYQVGEGYLRAIDAQLVARGDSRDSKVAVSGQI